MIRPRLIGMLSFDGTAAKRLSLFLDSLGEDSLNDFRILSDPGDTPVVAVAVSKFAVPAIPTATAPDGSFAIVDGLLSNADEIWPEATGRNDAEDLLRQYQHRGTRLFDDLDAVAVCTLWDAKSRKLLLVRDSVGNVPGYYTPIDGGLLWASDLMTLVDASGQRDIDLAALDQYLGAGFAPAPLTMVKGISCLQPATVLEIAGRDGITRHNYWRPTGKPPNKLSQTEVTAELDRLFDRAIERRFSGTGKAAVLLSGGVDSKLILAVMARRESADIESYTFRYGDYSGQLNEGDLAQACADHFGIRHSVIPFEPADVVDNLERMIETFGAPFSYGLHTVMLEDIRRAGISDVYCGIGADGWFLGDKDKRALRYLALPEPVRWLVSSAVPGLGMVARLFGVAGLSALASRARSRAYSVDWMNWRSHYRLPPLVAGAVTHRAERLPLYRDSSWVPGARERTDEIFTSALDMFRDETDREKFRFMSLRFFAADQMLNWTHWSARAHDLTILSPYNDREVLKFVHSLPMDEPGKPELRRLAATLMPRDMAYSPKVAQGVPLAKWMRGGMRDYLCDNLGESRLVESGIFSPTEVGRLLSQHLNGEKNHAWRLWTILSVQIWQDILRGRRRNPAANVISAAAK